MHSHIDLIKDTRQILAYAILSVVAFILTVNACILNLFLYQKFFGTFRPELIIIVVSLIGLMAILLLNDKAGFSFLKKNPLKGMMLSVLLSIPFGIIIITIDLLAVFPEDIALPFPSSLLIYPSLGFVAEILFHMVPLTVMVVLLGAFFRKTRIERIISWAILLSALIESIYHVVSMMPTVEFSIGYLLLMGVHIFLFSLCQLVLFRRFDFVTMFTMRLAYYLIWHILWGSIRVHILFQS